VYDFFVIFKLDSFLYSLEERTYMEENTKKIPAEYQKSNIRQHEDGVLKTSMQFFAEELLPYFNVEGKVISFAPTELVHLELQKLYQDFNFIMEDGTWKHFEFQSTNEGIVGLKRFRVYEALTSYQYNVVVETYVLFSGNIKNPMTEFTEGYNTYRVKPIIMYQKDADKLLEKLEQKQKNGELITKEDLVPLALCPLMGGKSSHKDRISKAFYIIQNAERVKKEDKDKMVAMLYAMADKFLEVIDLERLKEEIAMTRLGQMIWEDGVAEGEAKGRLATFIELIRDGVITTKEAAQRLNMTQDELNALLKN